MLSGKLILFIGTLFYFLLVTSAGAKLYDLPFKGQDLKDNEKIYWGRKIHSSGGVQKHGYDLGAMRYDSSAKKWTDKTVSASKYKSNPKNRYWVIYGKPIYATRSGKVIACWRNAPQNPKPGSLHPKVDAGYVYGGGNGFWIEHSDGSRVEYAHMIPGTVPKKLCPHNAVLLPSKISSPAVGKAWKHISVPASKQVKIKRGQFLGKVGNAGTSSAPHLHIHLQKDGKPVKFYFRRGLSSARNHKNPYGKWTRFAKKPIPAGPVLVWPPETVRAEYSRHGFPQAGFQAMFDHLADSGYQLKWNDGYTVKGRTYYNMIWKPRKTKWRAYIGKTGSGYQKVFNKYTKAGYVPTQVDVHTTSGGVRYNVIFEKKKIKFYARNNLTDAQHVKVFQKAKKMGLSPISISVASVNGKRRYTVLYQKKNIGSWVTKSRLSSSAYQNLVTQQSKKGRRPVYINSYMHNGKVNYTAIFATRPKGSLRAKHGLTGSQYQSNWKSYLGKGFHTLVVSGIDGYKAHRFAVVWIK